MERFTVIALIIALIVFIIIVAYIYYIYTRNGDDVIPPWDENIPRPDMHYCTHLLIKRTVIQPNNLPILVPSTTITTTTTRCLGEREGFGFLGYSSQVAGTSPWCVLNSPLRGSQLENHLIVPGANCDAKVMVIYLPTRQDFAPGLVPMYIYESLFGENYVTRVSLTQLTIPNARLIGTPYVFRPQDPL